MRELITDELLLDVMTRIAADRVGYKVGFGRVETLREPHQ